ncbi:MAG: hypothetical protein NTU73_08475, partial [Ignavibacteriae bacterium]|nr:hypothetical protein [Ignavibacteriota bacterium]
RNKLGNNKSVLYADALKDEILKYQDIPKSFTDKLFDKPNNNFGYYQTVANLLTALRVKDVFFNISQNKSRKDINFIEYKNGNHNLR